MDTSGPPASPRTPPRGRSAYPAHLARAGEGPRVPLHRRGTSQTFECLEDLLREAGFKETRVFTPEAERTEAAAEARKKQAERKRDGKGNRTEKKGVAGLVGFLSGLVPWSDTEGSRRTVGSRQAKTQSLGRAPGKQKQLLLNEEDESLRATDSSPDALVTPTPHRRRPFTPILTSDFSSPGSSSSASSHSPPQPHPQPQSRPSPNQPTSKQLERTRPDARTTLRHMISMPDFALDQGTSHPAHVLARRVTANMASPRGALHQQTTRIRQRGPETQLETEAETLPPLPQNWLSTVAHAVIGASGTGAHVGRPQTPSQSQGHAHPRSVRTDATRPLSDLQCSSEYARRDGSLARRGFAPRTPRADTTHGVVTAAFVVCRSAPGSRSSSLVRTRSTGTRARGRPQTRVRDTCLPSLGVTSVELAGARAKEDESYDANTNSDAAHASADHSEVNYDDDSSDEGELDFARLIVPARRQHSIHSLRRHLHNHAAASAASGASKPPPSAYTAYNRVPKRPNSQVNIRSRTNLTNTSESGSDVLNDPDGLNEILRSRRVSTDEDTEDELLADWAAQGLPGLESAVHKKRGALPWTGRGQGR